MVGVEACVSSPAGGKVLLTWPVFNTIKVDSDAQCHNVTAADRGHPHFVAVLIVTVCVCKGGLNLP